MTQRTPKQSDCLHLWLRLVSEALNDAGLDMKTVLAAKSVDVPWTETSVKEILWKPIQKAMTSEESTTQVSTTDYPSVYNVLCRHFEQHMGMVLPLWPDRFSQGHSDDS